jgi:hypothetical protein
VSRSYKQATDVGRARETVAALQAQLEELEAQLAAELETLGGALDLATEALEPVVVKPRRLDVSVRAVGLAWAPS